MQLATPLRGTRRLVSVFRIWYGGLKGVVGKDIAMWDLSRQEQLTQLFGGDGGVD